MNRHAPLLLTCGVLIFSLGCGPMRQPMAERLDKKAQQKVDEAWESALSPVNRLDHQPLLDVFVGTGAYQRGVDKLNFRSEKRFSGGTVVMEVMFEREFPDKDRFEVTVLDRQGKQLRREVYGRKEVEQTYKDLWKQHRKPEPEEEQNPEAAEKVRKYKETEARWKEIQKFFPKDDEKLP
jgi:hypothetical protein